MISLTHVTKNFGARRAVDDLTLTVPADGTATGNFELVRHSAKEEAPLAGVRMARYKMFFTSAKAERELGYRARPYHEGVADALRWFRTAGYLT